MAILIGIKRHEEGIVEYDVCRNRQIWFLDVGQYVGLRLCLLALHFEEPAGPGSLTAEICDKKKSPMYLSHVIEAHVRSYESPLIAQAGDLGKMGHKEEGVPEWIWVEHEHTGLSGWTPIELLTSDTAGNGGGLQT